MSNGYSKEIENILPFSSVELPHQSIENIPFRLCYDSKFFPIAYELENRLKQNPDTLIESIVSSNREEVAFKNPQELKYVRQNETVGSILNSRLASGAQIITLNTPEANAISIGRLTSPDIRQAKFQLARFHIGPSAIEDMRLAARQAIQIPAVKDLLTRQYKGSTGFILLTREGQLIDPNVGFYKDTGLAIPTTVATISHSTDNRVPIFGRVALIQKVNCEALQKHKPKSVWIFDNTASGMQQTAMLEELINQFESNGNQLEHITIFSPLLTLYGAEIISNFAKEKKLNTLFVCNGAILGCNPPDRYYSPIADSKDLLPDPNLLKVVKAAHGDLAGIACARCNWTESFLSSNSPISKAITDSEEELQMYGYSNQYLQDISRGLDPSTLREFGIELRQFLPYSSYLDGQLS